MEAARPVRRRTLANSRMTALQRTGSVSKQYLLPGIAVRPELGPRPFPAADMRGLGHRWTENKQIPTFHTLVTSLMAKRMFSAKGD
jgi:hypothetical protein